LLFWIFPTLRDGNAGFLPVTIVSLILTFILRGRSREKKENSADYIAIARQRDHAIDSIRNPSSSEQSGSPGRLSAPPNHSHSQFSPSPSTHQASPVAAKATHSEKCTGCGGILWSYEHGLCANCRKTSSTVESQAEPIDRPFAQHIDPSINNLMRKHGVTKDGVQYLWKGCRFSSSNKLVEALMQYERTRSRN
jgi:hypothetical protein